MKRLVIRKSVDLTGKGDKATVESLAKKYKVTIDLMKKQYSMGMKTELEHTKDPKVASQITLDHLAEKPNYYTKLKGAGLADELKKSSSQDQSRMIKAKYLKRTGTPGHYQYVYKEGEGRTAKEVDPEKAPKKEVPEQIAPDKFDAEAYFHKTNDPNASVESVMGGASQKVKDKIAETEAKLKEITPTINKHRKSGEGVASVYTPEREKLHEQIIMRMLSPEKIKKATPTGKPEFIILGGRGGSGKSWFNGKVYDSNKAIVLDSDEIKGQLPEYEGWNAFEVHEESSDIMEKAEAMAKAYGLNIVIDATMKTTSSAVARVQSYKDQGYEIKAHYMHCPRQTSAQRAVKRFGGASGRYVPVGVVLSNVSNEKTFDAVKPYASSWSFLDSSGTPPPNLISKKNGAFAMAKAIENKVSRKGVKADPHDLYDFGKVPNEKDYSPRLKSLIKKNAPGKKLGLRKSLKNGIPKKKENKLAFLKNLSKPKADYDRSYKLQGRCKWNGLDIAIENKKGSYRRGKDLNGKPWKTFMNFPYGRIAGSKAVDEEGVDIYMGSDETASMVYVVHQVDPFNNNKYDEDKVMVNFPSKESAIAGYQSQYNRPDFLGAISEFTIPEFKEALEEHWGAILYNSPLAKSIKDLDYWKEKLTSLLRMTKSLKDILYPRAMIKSIEDIPELIKGRGYATGTIRTWSGKKFKKLSNGKWVQSYSGENTRGERQAVRNVALKIQKASSMAELSEIVSANMQRFKDDKGKTLPIVKEFMSIARETDPGKKIPKKVVVKKPITNEEIGAKAKLENQQRIADEFEVPLKTVQDLSEKYRKDYPRRKVNIDTVRNLVRDSIIKDTDDVQTKLDGAKKQLKELSGKKPSGIDKIKDQYNSGKKLSGDTDDIYIGDEEITGTWKIVEADAPSASHDETSFSKTEGFPTNSDGSTINDRDYEKDKQAQESVLKIASSFDGRALHFDSPVVVTNDGVVLSGNNRTMSSKLSAKKGTDTKYKEALIKRSKKFGFKPSDIEKFKNPRVVFEVTKKEDYTTKQFAKFNESSTKTMNPVELAVKVSKTMTAETVKEVSDKIQEFETMGELYSNKKASNDVFNSLQKGEIINEFTRNQYITEDGITGAGKEFLETAMIGSVINESNIRGLSKEGFKNIRKKLVRSITSLVENKSMQDYAITDELNQAVDVLLQVTAQKDKFADVADFAKQGTMFEKNNPVAIELAKKLEMKEKDFSDFMGKMNASLSVGASGQADLFFGEVETKKEVLDRMLNLRKALNKVKRLAVRRSSNG